MTGRTPISSRKGAVAVSNNSGMPDHVLVFFVVLFVILSIAVLLQFGDGLTGAVGLGKSIDIVIAPSGSLNCSFVALVNKSCDAGFTKIMGLSNQTNAHAELPNQTVYDVSLCCKDNNGSIISTTGGTKIMNLSNYTNAHVGIPGLTTYTFAVNVSSSGGAINCYTNQTGLGGCFPSWTCMSTISNDTNAHVSNCTAAVAYNKTICCSIGGVISVYLHPNIPPTSGLVGNGSINGALVSGTDTSYATQFITYNNLTTSQRYLQVLGNFNQTTVDARSLTIAANTTAVVANTSGVLGIALNHTLFISNTSVRNVGVRVCPQAQTISGVNTTCTNGINYTGVFPQSNNGLVVSVSGSDYRIDGLNSSGVMLLTVVNSTVTNSTVINSTIINSTKANSNNTNCVIANSTENLTVCTNSTITNSSKYNTSVNNSNNFGCNVVNSSETNVNCINSNITNSTMTNSTVTNSTKKNVTMVNSTNVGCTAINSTELSANCTNSNLTNVTIALSNSTDSTKINTVVVSSNNINCQVNLSTEATTNCTNSNLTNVTTVNSTVTNSTKINSTVVNSANINCAVNNSIEVNSNCTNTILSNTTVILSTVTNSTKINSIIINSTVINSNNTNVTIINGVEFNSTSQNSNISNSTVNSSVIIGTVVNDSTVINSTKINSTIINSSVLGSVDINCTVRNASEQQVSCLNSNLTNTTIVNLTVINASIVGQFCSNGVIHVGNRVFNCPLFIFELQPLNLTKSKVDNPDPVVKGHQLNYTIFITNRDNATAFNVSVLDTYPLGTVFVASSPAPTSGNNNFSVGNIAPSATVTINITLAVLTTVVNGTLLNNTINITHFRANGIDFSITNTTQTTAVGFPNITTNKTDVPDPVAEGATLNYTINVTNSGDEFAYNVSVKDIYPGGLLFLLSQPVATSGNNFFFLGTLAPNQSVLINVSLMVNPGAFWSEVQINNSYNVTLNSSFGTSLNVTNSTNTTVLGTPTLSGNNPGVGGAGPAFSPQTYSMNTASYSTEYLRKNDQVTFMVTNELHTLTVLDIRGDAVSLRTASIPHQFDLKAGETKSVDVTGENIPDLEIRVIEILPGKTKLDIKLIARQAVPGPVTAPPYYGAGSSSGSPGEEAPASTDMAGTYRKPSDTLPVKLQPEKQQRMYFSAGIIFVALALLAYMVWHRKIEPHTVEELTSATPLSLPSEDHVEPQVMNVGLEQNIPLPEITPSPLISEIERILHPVPKVKKERVHVIKEKKVPVKKVKPVRVKKAPDPKKTKEQLELERYESAIRARIRRETEKRLGRKIR